jgi:hypothetical protein
MDNFVENFMAIERVNVLGISISAISLETTIKTVVGGKIADDFNPIVNDIKAKKIFQPQLAGFLGLNLYAAGNSMRTPTI